jgi:hypothetical protein
MKKCRQCGIDFDNFSPDPDMCLNCAKEQEQGTSLVYKLIGEGHPYHCAFRQVWGDGECECKAYEKGYEPYAWTGFLNQTKDEQ